MSFDQHENHTSGDHRFDRDTSVRPIGVEGDVHTYSCRVAEGWDILGNANGGYLLAIVGRALSHATGRPDCITVTAHYLAPAPVADGRIVVTVVRSGRRFATATASLYLTVDGRERETLRALATLGDLRTDPGGPTMLLESMPDIAPIDECIGTNTEATLPALHGRLDCRFDPRDAGFRLGQKSGDARMRGWFGFADGRPVDSAALLLACDAFPPTVFHLDLPVAWVPTVELTFHLRAIPAAGPVACSFRTRYVQNGLLEEDGEMWDSSGTLVGLSRQIALAPRANH